MGERVEHMREIQEQAMAVYGELPDAGGSFSHVIVASRNLDSQLDSEVRHVTLSAQGLKHALSRLFVECLVSIIGCDITMPDGTRRKVPYEVHDACELLREIFRVKNDLYGNSFGRHGAVGVVIRLLDQVSKVEHATNDITRASGVAHIANFSVMALMVLVEADPEFMS